MAAQALNMVNMADMAAYGLKTTDHNQNTSLNHNIREDVEANSEEENDERETIGKNWVRNIS